MKATREQPKAVDDWTALYGELLEAFSPGAPIQERDFLAGRIEQIAALMDAFHQRGRHAILFGERGVGKTSLANVTALLMSNPARQTFSIRINATPDDSFDTLWRKVLKRLTYQDEETGAKRRIADEYPQPLTPDDVQMIFEDIAPHQRTIVVMDEFDRIADKQVTVQVADTIKALSDFSANVTVIIVGVAEAVTELVRGHESIARALVQVKMPRMSQDELADILVKRYKSLGLGISEEGVWKITFLSRGLPYYTHLLGLSAGRVAIGRREITISDSAIDAALETCINDVDHTVKDAYYSATTSQRGEEALFEPVLLACALTHCDEMGRFQQTQVAAPLAQILPGKNYQPNIFAFHMNEFCEVKRGAVLERLGEVRNYRYRFRDPMMQPFIVLKALLDKKIDERILNIYATKRQLSLSI
jgi:Cdc6-like AAA superfamily ATPase